MEIKKNIIFKKINKKYNNKNLIDLGLQIKYYIQGHDSKIKNIKTRQMIHEYQQKLFNYMLKLEKEKNKLKEIYDKLGS